jgi:dsRNA-specific ribonuclease
LSKLYRLTIDKTEWDRLEWVGDADLKRIQTRLLASKYPHLPAGHLSVRNISFTPLIYIARPEPH